MDLLYILLKSGLILIHKHIVPQSQQRTPDQLLQLWSEFVRNPNIELNPR